MRFAEIALFLAPILIFAAWRAVSIRGGATPAFVAAVTAGVLILLGMLLLFWYQGTEPPGAMYVPARRENGQIVPSHIEYPDRPHP